MQFANYIYNSSIYIYQSPLYQSLTSLGPLKMPTSNMAAVASAVASATGTVFRMAVGLISSTQEEQVPPGHVPSQRNWTSAVNGFALSAAMMIVACNMKRNIFSFSLIVMGNVGFYTSLIHLTFAGYTETEFGYNWGNSRWFYE